MFGDIPILSQQFQLHNIQPATGNGLWPLEAQQFCIKLTIERQCDLEVIERSSNDNEASQVDTCRLKLFNKYRDLAFALVTHGHAKFINEPSDPASL